jgi:hypothetical protein
MANKYARLAKSSQKFQTIVPMIFGIFIFFIERTYDGPIALYI